MPCLSLRKAVTLFVLFAAILETSLASILAVDYGSDWIKASLMKPGVPFDVLLNKDSKRKIQSSVAWKKDERLFGSDAANIASRFPQDSFSSLKYLQGAPFNSDIVTYFTSISTAQISETDRQTVALKQSDGTEWSTEELVAMQLSYIKKLAEDLAGEPVNEVILTVPPYFSQLERDSITDAIEIAGLKTLALINDGTAVAINYAMTRSFSTTPEYHVIYDAGASSTRATVVSFAAAEDSKTKASFTQINVLGVGHDRNTGGTELDLRLRDILIDSFMSKHRRDIRKDKRGMAKLWKEAGRVKAILSANSDATSTVESVAFDIDFKTKVARAEFENACKDLHSRFARPIYDALSNAELSLENISSVILTGGNSRTPMVQAAVKSAVGEDRIALNVNADESAVLGAALYGASLSRQFKTKDIRVTDVLIHDIQASYLASTPGTRTIHTAVLPAGSKHGARKTLTFKRKEDFSLVLNYPNEVMSGFPREILEAKIVGIPEAIDNLTERGAIDPVIKATVVLSESGFVTVKDAVAYGEIKDDSITGKLKGLFGGGGDQVPLETDVDGEIPKDEKTDKKDKAKKPFVKDQSTIPLEIEIVYNYQGPLSPTAKRAARDRLRTLDNMEMSKQRREEAHNTLEGYLYKLRDLLNDGPETPFTKCSQPSERQALSNKLSETIAWLHDEGDTADTVRLWEKRSLLETLEKPIVHRYKEIESFPQALNNSQKWNWSTRLFLTQARENVTADAIAGVPSKWSSQELDALETALKEHEAWLHDGVERQKKTKMNEDPAIETKEMQERAKTLEQHLQRLVRRKAPKVKKTPAKSGDASGSSAGPTQTPGDKQPGHDEL
ncbi:Hsp70 protein-domain-containing protein [Suillus clintonianus]|uniref:Hsp70 protein-domain-containing protein n=1 Tax=Suillus clintonianus TaxID=1904413 RepID=UPI001B86A483|nr:Hsp70 protein-domain-containing protein [Suillus clintonianus]KAG2117711.1 Hsp70 protein-domain-containing protein [Suillus clintonianus]